MSSLALYSDCIHRADFSVSRKAALPKVALLSLCLAVLGAHAQTITYTPTTPQAASDVVPAGVGAIKVIVMGGAGGAGAYDGILGGKGAAGTQVDAIIRVQPGQTITALAAGGGKGGSTYARNPPSLSGGAGGSGAGAGGNGAAMGPIAVSGGGAGGGGASSLNVGGSWVLAGGGGGGGGDSYQAAPVADASAIALFTPEVSECATPATGNAGIQSTGDGGGGGGGGGGYQGAAGTGGTFGLDGVQSAGPGGMGGSCTYGSGTNTITNPVATVPGAPTTPAPAVDPSPNGADGLVSFEYIYQPTITIACDKSALTDGPNQQSVCTVTASTPAPVGGLLVPFTISAADPQYSTSSCSSPVMIPEGQTQAPACTIVAANNQIAGEAPVTVVLQITDSNDYLTGSPAQASVVITNDDNTVTPPVAAQPVPTLGSWGTLLLTALLVVSVWVRRKALIAGR